MTAPDEVPFVPHILTHRPRALLVAGALLLTGCGLSDYAGQMSSEAARVHSWDEESWLLGPPARMPELPKKDDKKQSWDVFLRLPRGVGDAPRKVLGSTQAELFGPLVKYEGNNTFGIRNVYLGVGSDPKDFANSVFSNFGVSPGGDAVAIPRSPILLSSTGRALATAIDVKRRAAEGQYAYSFNFYEHGGKQVAVVFEMDKATGAKAEPAIKASLATLGEGDEVPRMKAVYLTPNRPARK